MRAGFDRNRDDGDDDTRKQVEFVDKPWGRLTCGYIAPSEVLTESRDSKLQSLLPQAAEALEPAACSLLLLT
jgi:hypothetical protein